jgi:hypothetical protein
VDEMGSRETQEASRVHWGIADTWKLEETGGGLVM